MLFEMPVSAPSPYLSDRVDQSFLALRQRMVEEVGWDYLGQLDHMFEALAERHIPGTDRRTWNKAGCAFDLPYQEALTFEPRVEVVREERHLATFWRLFVQAEAQDGSQGEPLRELAWDFRARFGDEPQYYDEGGLMKERIPGGYYVDFTTLAADYGWQRTASTPNWRTFFPGILFGHYENRQALTWEERRCWKFMPKLNSPLPLAISNRIWQIVLAAWLFLLAGCGGGEGGRTHGRSSGHRPGNSHQSGGSGGGGG
ncbi:MAG: hypothetical protein M5U34_19085 [Chloroflexi bacterium]|nr:hypothetical protein [Chloroflexota bacterium]